MKAMPERMLDEVILNKARRALQELRVDAALLDEQTSIAWITGYAPQVIHGPNPFEAGGPLLWLDRDRVILLVSDAEQLAVAASGAETITYMGYQIDGPLRPVEAMLGAFENLLATVSRPHRLGIDNLPFRFWQSIHQRWTDLEIDVISGWTSGIRAVKTPAEIEHIRAACRLSSLAQAVLRKTELVNHTELELFDTILQAMEQEAGTRLTVLADLVAGIRTAGIGGMPSAYRVQPDDPVLADVVPRLGAYWGDICNVHFAGQASTSLRNAYHAARNALFETISAARPGRRANELDRIARHTIEQYGFTAHPHHTGHGIGVACHEEPRICGYNDTPLEPGMVIALEPGIYQESVGGVRLEHVILITENDPLILTELIMEI